MDAEQINKYADYWYYQIGVNIIPVVSKYKSGKKGYAWEQYQFKPIPEDVFARWKSENAFTDGIGVIAGKIWRGSQYSASKDKYLIFIDCDNSLAIREFCTRKGETVSLQTVAKDFIIEQHPDNENKCHIMFYSDIPFPKKSSDKSKLKTMDVDDEELVPFPLYEIKGKGSHGLAFATPSMHKHGHRYEIIGTSDPITLEEKTAIETQNHIDSICKKYDLSYLESIDRSGDSKIPLAALFEEDFQIYKGQNRHEAILRAMDSIIDYAKRHPTKNNVFVKKIPWLVNEKQCSPPLSNSEMDKLWKQANEYMGKQFKKRGLDLPQLTPEEQELVSERDKLHLRLIQEFKQNSHNIPIIPISQLGMDYGEDPVIVNGIVMGLSPIMPDWSMAKYVCRGCDQANLPDIHDERRPPKSCRMCDNKNDGFDVRIDYNKEPKLNQQTILLQDGSESLHCILTGLQSEMWPVKAGQKVHALGIQRYETYYNPKTHSNDWKKYFKLLSIKPLSGQEIEVTEQDTQYFEDLARMPNFIEDILVPSIAPHIAGSSVMDAKLLIAYALSSQGLERPFNCLIVGPPASGKTEMVQWASDVSWYGNLVNFLNTSIAGLVTETKRDPISGGMITVPGILSIYSMACFTDLNGAIHNPDSKKLLYGLNDALERKISTSAKAGGAQSFDARCVILSDSNNEDGDWDYLESVTNNMRFLPRSTISRYDMIVLIEKTTSEESHYDKVADANYDTYRDKLSTIKLHEEDWVDKDTGAPRLGFETLRKYFYYICSQPLPKLPDDETVKAFFKENYKLIMKNNHARLLDGRYNRTVMTLARVRARMLLKPDAELEDLIPSIMFINKCKDVQTLVPRTGEHDANPARGLDSKEDIAISKSVRLKQFADACIALQKEDANGFTKQQLFEKLRHMEGTQWHERDVVYTKVDEFIENGYMQLVGVGLYKWV